MILRIRDYCAILLQICLRIFPINNRKLLSFSYGGQGYGDQGKYVCNELTCLQKDVEIIWTLNKNSQLGDVPSNVKPVRFHSLMFFYHLVTSKVWISNMRIPPYFVKRKGQYYIQLWHGAPALKCIEADAEDALSPSYIRNAKHDSHLADLFISNSRYWTDLIKKSFWYDGPVLECGMPRLDRLINRTAQTKTVIKKKFHITADNVLLYAPTFRKDMNLACYALDYQKLKHTLEKKTGKTWHVGVRLHPNITNCNIKLPKVADVTDFSTYSDMYELMEMTDLLITDYSSTMFEAGFAQIPVILFATDIEKYRKDRNFYFEFDELPFPLVTSNEALFQQIRCWDQQAYEAALTAFNVKLGINEKGTASKHIAEHILEVINFKP